MPRPDGIDAYTVVPLFVRLASARLVLAEGGASRPPFWRRLCAWTQGGLLGRLCWSVEIDLDAVRASVAGAETLAVVYGRTLDLHQAQMYAAGETSTLQLRAEILGRLALLRQRHQTSGHDIPGGEAVARACERLTEGGLPLGWELPGPLEGHVRPARALPSEVAESIARGFVATPSTATWAGLSHLAQLFTLDEDLRTQMLSSLQKLSAAPIAERRRDLLTMLEQACRVAAAHHDEALADAAAAGVQRQAHTAEDQDIARIVNLLVLAGAAIAAEDRRTAWLGNQLAELAGCVPATSAPRLKECLKELQHVAPVSAAFWARAEFLIAAA